MVRPSFDRQHVVGRGRMGDFPMDPRDHRSRLSAASFIAAEIRADRI
jgi:hypothetical protein